MIAKFWRKDHFVAIQTDTQATIESDSLLLYMPLVLGRQLPEYVRAAMIAALKQPGGFLTENGLASERVTSKLYEADGYWRGPISVSYTHLKSTPWKCHFAGMVTETAFMPLNDGSVMYFTCRAPEESSLAVSAVGALCGAPPLAAALILATRAS